jgi:protein SCO1/2
MLTKDILLKRVLPSIFVTTIVLIVVAFFMVKKKSTKFHEVDVSFNLEDMNGNLFNEKILKQKHSLLFFGFTHCPDVCPASLQLLTNLIEEMGKDAGKINYYFFTADPDRDTKEVLKKYLSSFNPKILGVTGKKEELQKLYQALDIYIKKVDLGKDNYTIDHTASFTILNSDSEKVGTMIHEGFSKLMIIDNLGKIQFPKEDVVGHLKKLLEP